MSVDWIRTEGDLVESFEEFFATPARRPRTRLASEAENEVPDPPWTGQVPPRRPDAQGGRAFMATIAGVLGKAREDRIEAELLGGNLPDFLRTPQIVLVFVPARDGASKAVAYRVMPDYLCIGSDADHVRIPVNAITAQRVADAFHLMLPTARMVDQIHQSAAVPLAAVVPPYSGTPEQVQSVKFLDHHDRIQEQIARLDALTSDQRRPPWRIARWRLGALVSGHKKEVVTSTLAYRYPDKLMFYGWFKADGVPIQPASGVRGIAAVAHDPTFSDYSQGARLVSRTVLVSGQSMPVTDVLRSEDLHVLLNGEGSPYPGNREPRATVRVAVPSSSGGATAREGTDLDLVPVTDSSIRRITLYPRITHGGEGPAAAVTGVFVPRAFQPSPTIDAIVYLHGHHTGGGYPPDLNIYDHWSRTRYRHYRFREELNLTERSIVLIAPTLGPGSQAGWLTDAGGLDRFLEKVRQELVASPVGISASATWGKLVLASHSGGGRPMRQIATATNKLGGNITECWGFDCLYNDDDVAAWPGWAQQGGKRLYIYYGDGGTAKRSKDLLAEARRQWLANLTIYVDGSTSTPHVEVPIKYWRERIQALP
jgi:hypothetical protein